MKSRIFNIDLSVSIPFSDNKHYTEDDVKTLIQQCLKNNIMSIENLTVTKEHIYAQSDDITTFTSPIGYIAPDGRFYGCEPTDFSFAHITIADEIWKYYFPKEYIEKHDEKRNDSLNNIDYQLERYGFIKIQDKSIQYYVHLREAPIYWTDKQIETVYEYIKHIEKTCNKKVYIGNKRNGKYVMSSEFIQMDKFAIMDCFRF